MPIPPRHELCNNDRVMELNRYHFSLGDSSEGPIGYCAAVWAADAEAALALLQESVEYCEAGPSIDASGDKETPGIEYVQAYWGRRDSITLADIDEVSDAEGNELDLDEEVSS